MGAYIVADPKFCQSEERDKILIENWNQTIKDEDYTILLGELVDKERCDWDRIKEIFDSLNGSKEIISVKKSNEDYEKWRNVLGKDCLCVPASVKGTINNKKYCITIYPFANDVIVDKVLKDKEMYAAAPRSVTNQKEVFEDHILSISIDDWGMAPLEYTSVPRLIEDMLLFESMNIEEERVVGQKDN